MVDTDDIRKEEEMVNKNKCKCGCGWYEKGGGLVSGKDAKSQPN